MRRTYYRICEYCGSTLDPQETCDCQEARINMSDKVLNFDEKKKVIDRDDMSLKEYKDITETLTYAVLNLQNILDDIVATNHLELSGSYESARNMKARAHKAESSIYVKN